MPQHDSPAAATAAPGHPPPARPEPDGSAPGPRPLDIRATDQELLAARLVPLRRPGQWISAAVLLVLFAMLVHTVVTNPRFQWHVVGHYFLRASILHGLELTLWLTGAVMASGYLLGIGVAAMRLSRNPVLRSLSFGYVWLVRSVPPLVQLLFWYELASLYPRLSVGVPFGPEFAGVRTAHLFSGILAAYVGLTLDVAALSAEIVRGGILSVDPGQREAARALGLSEGRIFRRIVLPQAMPAIIPSSGNLLIGMLKATSIVSVIAVQDLLYSSQLIYNQNFLIMPLLLVATLWYVILTTLLSIGQFYVERFYARGSDRGAGKPPRGFWQVTRSNIPLFGPARSAAVGL
ncbi:amino acid ABC transporter membrane protein, PAAT family [Actinacidiphila yanglinensis]|uniref:Amino acid ABC transporter membrane protein, PAAT family n=1 Tax=Actinacidiphila yanglinensis TaxID=310779 RepID=A0A1H6B469_9ACTN|nr:amino acid ABC transporter permease [Actinacidiphila yanglinensis]SEG55628.1 amino acid ABC transporter membrane protein, PAAT family [Actinacidiphila yanglinensis]